MTKEAQRADLHKTIWRIANDLRGSVDGWDFKQYVLGMLFYRFISENLTAYLNEHERKAGSPDFDYAQLADGEAEFGRAETVSEKGFYILPTELFVNVRRAARNDENLNETLEDATNDAIALFGNKDARGIVLLKPYAEYYDEYAERVAELQADYPLGQPIVGETAQKAFIALFGAILRLRNILQSFDDFAGNEILTPRAMQDYQSIYLNLYQDLRGQRDADKEPIHEEIVFEIELIKQVEINVDYILMLVEQYRDAKGDGDAKEIRAAIDRAVSSSPSLRNKKDLIEEFVDALSATAEVDDAWAAFVAWKRTQELDRIIVEEGLDPEATRTFVDAAFRDGVVQSTGTAITKILPPVSRFGEGGGHAAKKQTVLGKLSEFFDRFFGLS